MGHGWQPGGAKTTIIKKLYERKRTKISVIGILKITKLKKLDDTYHINSKSDTEIRIVLRN